MHSTGKELSIVHASKYTLALLETPDQSSGRDVHYQIKVVTNRKHREPEGPVLWLSKVRELLQGLGFIMYFNV